MIPIKTWFQFEQNTRWWHDWCEINNQEGITSSVRPTTCKHAGSCSYGWRSRACHLFWKYDIRIHHTRSGLTRWTGDWQKTRYYHCMSEPSKKYKDLSLEQFFYRVFVHTTFKKSKNGNSDDNDERDAVASNEHRVLIPKGMNCILRYLVDYDYAWGMLILHKPWSKGNTLNSILKDHKKIINTFLFMIDNKEVPSLVTFQYHTAIKYSRQKKTWNTCQTGP